MERPKDSPKGPVPDDATASASRAFIHQCNNLLGGILNAVALLRRAKTEQDRAEAMGMIEDATHRAQVHLSELGNLMVKGGGGADVASAVAEICTPTENKTNGTKHSVLVVEDDEMNRQLLRKLLESTGLYNVTEAADGRQALEQYRSKPSDLVLLDIAMPGLSGEDVLERLRRLDTKSRVLLISGYIDSRDPLTRAPNVVGYLQKPIEPPVLFDTIRRLLSS